MKKLLTEKFIYVIKLYNNTEMRFNNSRLSFVFPNLSCTQILDNLCCCCSLLSNQNIDLFKLKTVNNTSMTENDNTIFLIVS